MASHSQRHQCIIYDGAPSPMLDQIAHIMAGKLASNHRCLFLNSPTMVAGMRSSLSAAGIDVAANVAKGSLVLTSDQGYLADAPFNPDAMIALLQRTLEQTLAEGYTGLWATGDMTWELGGKNNMHKLLEYEQKLNAFLENNPAIGGICQYHRDTLSAEHVLTALHTHPTVSINDTLSFLNPFFGNFDKTCPEN